MHVVPWAGKSSSSAPSQSSSRPLQTASSAAAGTTGSHDSNPPTQAVAPALHTPGWPVAHDPPPKSWSGTPSQSSSTPSQVASLAAAPASGAQLSVNTPATQLVSPVLPAHTPRPQVVAWGAKSSSIGPSQSLSTPSHTSTAPGYTELSPSSQSFASATKPGGCTQAWDLTLFGDAFRRYAIAVPKLVPRLHAYTPLGGDASGSVVWRSERFADNNETGTAVAVGIGVLAMAARGFLF